MSNNKLKFIDLFAGLGGIRLGFEQACHEKNKNCFLFVIKRAVAQN